MEEDSGQKHQQKQEEKSQNSFHQDDQNHQAQPNEHSEFQVEHENQGDNERIKQSNSKLQNINDRMMQSKVSVPKSQAISQLWKPYDFLFPGGKLAKLIKVSNIYRKNLPLRDMLDKFKFVQMTPVINIIGGMQNGRGKFYAGIARAAFNTDAVIVDNGLGYGLQKFTLRRGVKLIGIAPQGEIKFPKINPSKAEPMELANGHTHLFLVNNPDKDLRWGGEIDFKIDLCIKIAEGRNRAPGVNRCKIVSILMGDASFDSLEEVRKCIQMEIPIVVVPGSTICERIMKPTGEWQQLVEKGHFFNCNSTNSEDIAQLTHLLLSITPW